MIGIGIGIGFGTKPRIIVQDTFDRADSALTLGSANTGQTWNAVAGTWGVDTNQAYLVSDVDGGLIVTNSGLTNFIASVSMRGQINGTNIRIPQLVIKSDATIANALYTYNVQGMTYLSKVVGGVFTALAQTVQVLNDGQLYRFAATYNGTTVKVTVDGVQVISYTLTGGESLFNAFTYAGMRFVKSAAPTINARWDNFSVEVI